MRVCILNTKRVKRSSMVMPGLWTLEQNLAHRIMTLARDYSSTIIGMIIRDAKKAM